MASDKTKSWLYNIDLQLNEILDKKLEKKSGEPSKIAVFYKAALEQVAPELALKIFGALKTKMPSMLKENRRAKATFEGMHIDYWKEPLDMLEAFLQLSIEIGTEINKEVRSTSREYSFLPDVLTRLQGQACLIGQEILVLMRSGYADGANARWRSLHEVVVIASFIQKNGEDVAERYFKHNIVESYKALVEYQNNEKRLKLTPFPQEEAREISEMRTELIKKYGKSYNNSYGWASSVLNIEKPNFLDMEKAADLGHLRPYYRLASHHVHSNPKSLHFKLGLLHRTRDIILSGPSTVGIADPGQGMAISLNQINTLVLSLRPSMTGIVVQKVMSMWLEELCNKFIKAHRLLEKQLKQG